MSGFCTKCGTAIPDGMKFCTNCGTAVPAGLVNNANNMRGQSSSLEETQSMWDGDSTMSVWNSPVVHTQNQPVQNNSSVAQNYNQPAQNQSVKNYAQQVHATNPGWDGDATIGLYDSNGSATQSIWGGSVQNSQSYQNYSQPAQSYNQPVQNSNKSIDSTANSNVKTQTSVGAETYEYSEIAKKTLTFGILGCALFWTVICGILFGILAINSTLKFNRNTIGLTSGKNDAGRILGIVGMALSALTLIIPAVLVLL